MKNQIKISPTPTYDSSQKFLSWVSFSFDVPTLPIEVFTHPMISSSTDVETPSRGLFSQEKKYLKLYKFYNLSFYQLKFIFHRKNHLLESLNLYKIKIIRTQVTLLL